LEILKRVLCDKDFHDVVFILETPNELEGYAKEIKLIRNLCTG